MMSLLFDESVKLVYEEIVHALKPGQGASVVWAEMESKVIDDNHKVRFSDVVMLPVFDPWK